LARESGVTKARVLGAYRRGVLRVKDHERLVARPDTEHRPPVATQDLGRSPLDQPGVIEVVSGRRVHGADPRGLASRTRSVVERVAGCHEPCQRIDSIASWRAR
jgi:hypothetical protein